MTISVTIDTAAFRRAAGDLARQIPFAMAMALNDTARDVVDGLKQEEDRVFDRPTPYAKNAFMTVRATKADPVATVKLRPSAGSRHFMKVEASGGPRPQTGIERLLSRHVQSSKDIRSVIPADGARLDRYGNWSAGQRNQVLSQVRAQSDSKMNETARSRKRGARKGRARYFVPRRGLTPGVYRRVNKNNVVPVVIFSSKVPKYRKRLDPHKVAHRVVTARFSAHFSTRFASAVATRRR